PLLALSVIGASTVGFVAVKLLPSLALVGVQPRLVPPIEVNHLRFFLLELFSRTQDPAIVHPGQDWGFYEYGAYVGIFYGGLALLGTTLRPARALPWLILSCMLLAL